MIKATFNEVNTSLVVIFLEFHSAKQGMPLVDSCSHGLDVNQKYSNHDTFEQSYPTRDTFRHMIKEWWKVAREKARKTRSVFFYVNANINPQAKKQRFANEFQNKNSS